MIAKKEGAAGQTRSRSGKPWTPVHVRRARAEEAKQASFGKWREEDDGSYRFVPNEGYEVRIGQTDSGQLAMWLYPSSEENEEEAG